MRFMNIDAANEAIQNLQADLRAVKAEACSNNDNLWAQILDLREARAALGREVDSLERQVAVQVDEAAKSEAAFRTAMDMWNDSQAEVRTLKDNAISLQATLDYSLALVAEGNRLRNKLADVTHDRDRLADGLIARWQAVQT